MKSEAAAARRTCCHYAVDAPEAREFMRMLGIYPGQEEESTLVGVPAIPNSYRTF